MAEISRYLHGMVRRTAPAACGVMDGTVPVVSFGDSRTARVATLGINPSSQEFVDKGGSFLVGAKRRLATLESLGATDSASLSDQQVVVVVDACAGYFGRNPYRKWFDPLNEVLGGLDVSYYDGTACHLDLVQWATDPIWSELDKIQRHILLTDGAPHLVTQLKAENIELVVVNGRGVWTQLQNVGLAIAETAGTMRYGKYQTKTELCVASGHGVTFVGWTVNLQSSPGANDKSLRRELSDWLRSVAPLTSHATDTGVLLPATTVTSKRDFADLLRRWLDASDADTVGAIGNYGRSVLIVVRLGGHVVVLNADTKRDAVAKYLDTVKAHGAEAPWRIMTNTNGLANKVDFNQSGPATPGWYCYATTPLTEGMLI